MKVRSLLGVVAAFFALCMVAPACIAGDTTLPTWKADPKLVVGLGPDVVLDGAAMRIPQTFTPYKTFTDNDYTNLEWHGPENPNGISPVFVFAARPLDTFPDNERTNSKFLSQHITVLETAMLGNDITDPTMSAQQQGVVNGYQFSRQYFKGYNHRWLRNIHGMFYTTASDKYVYLIGSFDEEPTSKYTLPVIEASILTFHSSDQPNSPFPQGPANQDNSQDRSDQ